MNPILKREFLARWRDRRSYLLLLALALCLGIAAHRSYDNALQSLALNYRIYPGIAAPQSLATRASRAGHALFTTLAIGNVAIWFVLAPLLLATGVAREREQGLLESLQLSPMRPSSQIVARTLSALSFLAILQLVTLPIYFLAFTFGGVSEQEIGRVWEIVAVSAFCGVGLGLALSAQAPRPSGALFGAVVVLVLWSLISFVLSNYIYVLAFLGMMKWVSPLSGTMYFSHPLALIWSLCERNNVSVPTFFGITRFGAEDALPWTLLGWGVVGALGLAKATRDVTRPLPPQGWAGRNTLIQKWKKRREERLKAQSEKRRAKVSVEGALLADLPFDRLIRFKNPLLNREVKSRFRLRRASAMVWTGRALIFLCGAALWIMVFFFVFFDPAGRPSAVPLIFWGEWLLGTALVSTFAASAFAREREAGTWEGICLSLVTPGQITRTKWASPLISFALLSSPLWLFLLVLCPIGNWNGIPFHWLALGALVIASSLSWISALGSWISLRAKNTASATCWTLGVLLALFVATPIVAQQLSIPRRIALWHSGVPQSLTDGFLEDYRLFEGRALYAKETGIQVQNPYQSGKRPTPTQVQEWERYINWGQRKNDEVQRFQRQLDFWHPALVISVLQDRGRTYGYTYSYLTLDDETVLAMAFLHIALAMTGTLVLLLGVNHRLQKQRD